MRDLFIFGDSILKGVYFSDECGKHKLVREQYAPLEEAGFLLHTVLAYVDWPTESSVLIREKLLKRVHMNN